MLPTPLLLALQSVRARLRGRPHPAGDGGFSTAELLGNAALAIAALVVIWGGMQQLGVDVVAQMRAALNL